MEKINDGALVELFKTDYLVSQKSQSFAKEIITKEDRNKEAVSLVVLTKEPLTAVDQKLLGAILSAVNIKIENTPILESSSFDEVRSTYESKNLISFGPTGFDIGIKSIQLDLYSPKEYEGVQVLIADKLSEIGASADKKKALWLNLKRLFNI